jgi:hypothetical protein
MDKALELSLNTYDSCQTNQPISSANNSETNGQGSTSNSLKNSAGVESSATSQNQEKTIESFPSSDMRGTEPEIEDLASKRNEMIPRFNSTDKKDVLLNNGKLPDDIPIQDNDSKLEAQIREAATNEKDPEIQKRLWNEYRKYKGLPTK